MNTIEQSKETETMTTMYAIRGLRQGDGARRFLGFASKEEARAAVRAVRADPTVWDALEPVAIIDRHPDEPGRYYPVRGSEAACRQLASMQ
jgi:hypothetical protein